MELKKQKIGSITIFFRDEDHKYFDSKENVYTSVTTVVGQQFPKFEESLIAEKLAKKYKVSKEVIINSWKKTSKIATDSGSNLHFYAENKLLNTGELVQVRKEDRKKRDSLKIFIKRLKKKFKILYVERILACPELLISGQVDLIVQCKKTGKVFILDWKTNAEITKENGFNEFGFRPCHKLPNTDYWHYHVQLNLYLYLARLNGLFLDADLGLLHITNDGVVEYEIQRDQNLIKKILRSRNKS